MNRQIIIQLSEYMEEAMQACFEMKLITKEGMEADMKLSGKPGVVITCKDETGKHAYQAKMPRTNRLTKDDDGMISLARLPKYTSIRMNNSHF